MLVCLFAFQSMAQAPELRTLPPLDPNNPLKELIGGEQFLAPTIRAMQDDAFDNPAAPTVELGEKLWSRADPPARSCASCHGDLRQSQMRRVFASYPKFDQASQKVITLGERVARCREQRSQGSPWSSYAPEMTAVTSYIASMSKGVPSSVDVSGPAAATFEKGKSLYYAKAGQLQLSCAQCHEDNYGQQYGAERLSQGHPQGFPAYRISENRMITLHDRFRLCNRLARAEQLAEGAPDYVALELYLNWRSKNLPFTAPGVRP
jgi:sulfur-oxidizing protein SoxA